MKKSPLLLFLLLFAHCFSSQVLHLYSVGDERQQAGDHGYTLDGIMMQSSPRMKLLNALNFGPTGTYKKSIVIHDTFIESGSLRGITKLPREHVFFFGSFDKSNGSTKPFTKEELDSLYSWSLKGGRVINTNGLTFLNGDFTIMNEIYGFTMLNSSGGEHLLPEPNLPVPNPFNGPFGVSQGAPQNGAAQGVYQAMPANVKVLAKDQAGRPTMYMDCKTMDVLVADVDVFTVLNNEMSAGANITSYSDILWGNTIAFLDLLQEAPLLQRDGDHLSVQNGFIGYQWYKNGSPVSGANGNNFTADGSGSYYVEVQVNGGCKTPSDIYYTTDVDPELNCDIVVPTAFSPDGNGVNELACAYSYCAKEIDFRIFDRWGELVFQSSKIGDCWDGTYKGKRLNRGSFAWTIKATLPSGKEFSHKGFISLVN